MMLVGNLFIGLAVGLFRMGGLGTDPFSTMNLGVSQVLGLQFGVYQLLFNCAVFIIVLLYGKHLIGLGTLVNMVMIGFIADFVIYLHKNVIVFEINLLLSIFFLVGGVVLAGFGLSLYITANIGVAPYDALPLIIQKFTNNRISFGKARITIDLLAVLIGFSLGAVVGIGTLLTAIAIGPLVEYFNTRYSEPVLEKHLNNDILVA